jgi:hypothetical protein
MAHVAIGDELLGQNRQGDLVFSPVRAWLHREPGAEVEMLEISAEAGRVIASAKHYLRTDSGYRVAGDFVFGQKLFTPAGVVSVRSVERVVRGGVFAPLTTTSNYFVGASNSSLVLAHNFAHFPPSMISEVFIHSVFSVAEWVIPDMHSVRTEWYIHPIAKILAPLFGIKLSSSEPGSANLVGQ